MATNGKPKKKIKASETAFDIIESIAERHRPSVTEIAEDVGHSRSTVHYHLETLREHRYVVSDDEGLRLGLRMARLGNLSLDRHCLSGIVQEPANELAKETDAVAHVAVQEGNDLVWLYRSSTDERDNLPTDIGTGTMMHCTAYGQAILAHMPPETVLELVDDLPSKTQHTLTDQDELRERLKTVRELGFAYSSQEFQEGISSIAAPILNENEEVVGSIGITDAQEQVNDPYKHTKARRFSDELPELVQKAAWITGHRLMDSS